MKKKIIISTTIIILLILISVGFIHFIDGNKKVNFKDYTFIPKHSEILTANISMKEYYKQKIIDNSLEYLNKNKIVLRDDLVIDTNSIIESDKCNGTTLFKPIKDAYQQIVDLECFDNDESSSSEFSSYLFDAKEKAPNKLIKISDGYLLLSDINITTKTDDNGYVYQESDTNISKIDQDFNLIWSYNYIEDIKEFPDSIEDEEFEEDDEELEEDNEEAEDDEDSIKKLCSTIIREAIEAGDKFFFLISFSDYSGNGNSKILILNKDGSLDNIYRFAEDENVYSMIKTNDEIIALSDKNTIYKYNYETGEINSIVLKTNDTIDLLGKIGSGYLMISNIDYYFDDELMFEGDNRLFIIDEKSREKKSLNIDKVIGITKDESDIDYEDIKIIDNKIYISYEVMKEDEEYTVLSYPGLLIVDKELNVISNIKYANREIKQKDREILISEISDYYIYNNELYVLLNLEDENNIIIDKYNVEGKKLLKSFERETYSTDEFEDNYFFTPPEVLDYSEKELTYYVVIRKEIEVGENIDSRVSVKLVKVNL